MNAPRNSTSSVRRFNTFIGHLDGWDVYYAENAGDTYFWLVGPNGNQAPDLREPNTVGASSFQWPTESILQYCQAYVNLIQ